MPLLQVCPTLNDRTPDNPWPDREQVPLGTYEALPADTFVCVLFSMTAQDYLWSSTKRHDLPTLCICDPFWFPEIP